MDDVVLRKIEVLAWLLVPVMSAAAWLSFSRPVAEAVLAGGLIAAASFGWLKRDLSRLFQGPLTAVKARFFIKYYARLSVLVLLLFCLIRYRQIHIMGMLVGLSVVLVSIGAAMIGEAKKLYFTVKEAL